LRIPKSDYSQIAKLYDKVRPDAAPVLISRIIEYGDIGKNKVVLDVGCGTGRFPLRMPTKNNLFVALEPSIDMLKQAVLKDKSRNVIWVRGDGQNLPFTDDTFNCVYMTSVIHHIEHKDMALGEIHRILREDGICLIMTFSHAGMKKHILHDFPGVTRMDLKRIPCIPSLKKMMITAGFNNVHYHVVKHDEGFVSTNGFLERVRNKYISTLTLLTDDEFQRGFSMFQKKAKKKYGSRIRKISRFVFVVGKK
jgi:ubiquinone/menaquinone biosynthesis C-methylase UbiE